MPYGSREPNEAPKPRLQPGNRGVATGQPIPGSEKYRLVLQAGPPGALPLSRRQPLDFCPVGIDLPGQRLVARLDRPLGRRHFPHDAQMTVPRRLVGRLDQPQQFLHLGAQPTHRLPVRRHGLPDGGFPPHLVAKNQEQQEGRDATLLQQLDE